MGTAKKAKYPIGFYICCITYTFERFAFYGTKPLLALFLAASVAEGGIGVTKAQAVKSQFGLTSLYIHHTNYRRMVKRPVLLRCQALCRSLGCIIMGLGYFCGWQAHSVPMVWVMILVVSIRYCILQGKPCCYYRTSV